MQRLLSLILLLCATSYSIMGQEVADSIVPAVSDSVDVKLPFYRKGIIGKVVHYFDETNKPKKAKKFDMSFIGGPYYSSDTKFGIGLVAAGLYRADTTDTITPVSDVSLYAKATTSMMFTLGLSGNHILKHDRSRFVYDVNFSSIKTYFWGIGYDKDVDDANKSSYRYLNSQIRASYVWKLAPNFYLGPLVSFDYINGSKFQKPELWEGAVI